MSLMSKRVSDSRQNTHTHTHTQQQQQQRTHTHTYTSPQVWDIARERLAHTCNHHTKGVHGFVWCRAYSLFASCGMERDVMIWQAGPRP